MQLFKESIETPGVIVEEREIPSDLALVSPLVVRVLHRIHSEGWIDDDRVNKVKLCLDEAITNAVKHGNKLDFDKTVRVTLFKDDHSWGVVIRDEGVGFRLEDVAAASADPEENLWRENGRGLPLMSLYMDECAYYDGGSTLIMRQNFQAT